MSGMLETFAEIQRKLVAARIRFCCLKGFSLIPECYSSIRERHQVDCDLLVNANDTRHAAEILETLGYKLRHSGVSGELCFARPLTRHLTAKSWLYAVSEGMTVELHTRLWEKETELFVDVAASDGWEEGIQTCIVNGVDIPRLAPAWQFFHLLLHVFRHLLYDSWVRLISIYEIASYLEREQTNSELWREVTKLAAANRQLASICALILRMVGVGFPGQLPKPLDELCETYLSADSAIWVRHFAEHWLFANPPGTKLAILVQRQFCKDPSKWQLYMLRRLLPFRVPHGLGHDANAKIKQTTRYKVDDLFYRVSRFGYHLVSGCDYLWSAARWRQLNQSYNNRPAPLF
jgi:hypothetical protein